MCVLIDDSIAEEVRLLIVKLIRQIANTENYKKSFDWNISDFSNALSKIVLDQYADVKKVNSLFL